MKDAALLQDDCLSCLARPSSHSPVSPPIFAAAFGVFLLLNTGLGPQLQNGISAMSLAKVTSPLKEASVPPVLPPLLSTCCCTPRRWSLTHAGATLFCPLWPYACRRPSSRPS